jgi:hypothetical protein
MRGTWKSAATLSLAGVHLMIRPSGRLRTRRMAQSGHYNCEPMRWSIPRITLVSLLACAAPGVPAAGLHITIPNRTVHNSHYLAGSFFYQLQTMLGGDSGSPRACWTAGSFGIRARNCTSTWPGARRRRRYVRSPRAEYPGRYRSYRDERLHGQSVPPAHSSLSNFAGVTQRTSLSQQSKLDGDSRR